MHVNGRDPVPAGAKLQDSPPRHDRLHDPIAKPGAVAVYPTGKGGYDWKAGHDIALQSIQHRRQARSPAEGSQWCVLGDRTWTGHAVAARVRHVDHSACVPIRHRIQQVCIHRDAISYQRRRMSSPGAGFLQQRLRRDVKHPLSTWPRLATGPVAPDRRSRLQRLPGAHDARPPRTT